MNIDHQESWITSPASEVSLPLGTKVIFFAGAAMGVGLFGVFLYKLYTVAQEFVNGPPHANVNGHGGRAPPNGRAVPNRNAGENIPLQDMPDGHED